MEYIGELTQAKPIVLGGIEYSTLPAYLPPAEPLADPIVLSTLEGFVGFLDADIDDALVDERGEGDPSRHLVWVESPTSVSLLGPLKRRERKRECLVRAKATPPRQLDRFGQWWSLEEAQIYLRTACSDSGQRAELLELLARVSTQDEVRVADDGISQEMAVKAGTVRLARETVSPTWQLAPYRTFPEVTQPVSQYLLRAKKGEGGFVISLHLVCDGLWELEAISNVAGFLAGRVTEGLAVLR